MFSRIKLFAISVLPMWLLLFIKTVSIPYYFGKDWELAEWDEIFTVANIIAFCSAILFVASVLYCYRLCYRLKSSPSLLPVKIHGYTEKDVDYINTLATIVTLFSVLLIDYKGIRELILLLVLLFVIFVCYTKSNLYYCNPVFAAMGFKIAEVKTSNNNKLPDGSIVLYKDKLNERVEPYHVADNIYIQSYG